MLKKLVAVYEKIEEILAGIALICGIGIMFVGVVARLAKHPMTFVDEIAPIFIVWSSLLGYSIALRKDEHIKMDILYAAIKNEKIKKIFDIFGNLCCILFTFFVAFYGYRAMTMQMRMNRVTQIMEFPLWIAYSIIPFTGVVMTLRYIAMLIGTFRKKTDKEEEAEQ